MKLTTYDSTNATQQFQRTIVVTPAISTLTGTPISQQPLFVYKRFDAGQVAITRQTITGSSFNSNVAIGI